MRGVDEECVSMVKISGGERGLGRGEKLRSEVGKGRMFLERGKKRKSGRRGRVKLGK